MERNVFFVRLYGRLDGLHSAPASVWGTHGKLQRLKSLGEAAFAEIEAVLCSNLQEEFANGERPKHGGARLWDAMKDAGCEQKAAVCVQRVVRNELRQQRNPTEANFIFGERDEELSSPARAGWGKAAAHVPDEVVEIRT